MISSKRLANSWLPFTLGAATAALAITLTVGWRSPEPLPAPVVQQELPSKPAPAIAEPAATPAATPAAAPGAAGARVDYGAEPAGYAQPAPADTAAPAHNLVLVTATVQPFAMRPVAVTPTAVLSQAEEEARARAAIEAMRQSTEGLQAEMPGQP